MKVSKSSGRRFCAQWNIFFEYDSPTCLRLRPIASLNHPLRRAEQQNVILRDELVEIDARLRKVPIQVDDLSMLIEDRPEYAAFSIGSKLFSLGYHEKYLASLEADFREIILPDEKKKKYIHNRLIKYFDEGGKIDFSSSGKLEGFVCYFCVNNGVEAINNNSAFNVRSFSQIDDEISDKFRDDASLSDVDKKLFISVQLDALDANSAVDRAIGLIARLGRLKSIGFYQSRVDPYADFHRNAVVKTMERVIRFDWKTFRVSYKGLFNRDIRNYKAWIDKSESFAGLIDCYSEAVHYALIGDVRLSCRILFNGIDLLFKPAFVTPGIVYKQADFRSYAARFMAMQAMRNIFESCFFEGDLIKETGMGGIDALTPAEFKRNIENRLNDSYVAYRTLIKATYISRWLQNVSEFKRAYRRNLTRYYADFNHVVVMRNLFVHENSFQGEEYYLTELMQLFRYVITFRLSNFDSAETLPISGFMIEGRNVNLGDMIFSYYIKLLMVDSEYLLMRGSPVWLSSRSLPEIYGCGWGLWKSKSLDAAALKNLGGLKYLVDEFRPKEIEFSELESIEIL